MSTLKIAWYNLENLFEPSKHPEKNSRKIGSGLEMTHFPLILACC